MNRIIRLIILPLMLVAVLDTTAEEDIIFCEKFENLKNWHKEGAGNVKIKEPGVLRIECVGSEQGGVGCMAFCRTDFPDHVAFEYELQVIESDGLVISFIAMQGLNGEDMIEDFPPRKGQFKDYVDENGPLRSYHVSVSRYNDEGEHTGVSNWRRNPGLHLMGQGKDLCKEIKRKYKIRIEKDGPRCALFVDGKPGPNFTDPQELPGPIPEEGKFGFRTIGTKVIAEISNFRVKRLENSKES